MLMVVMAVSCSKWDPEMSGNKTVLVYMSGDTGYGDLSAYINDNLRSMAQGMDAYVSSYNNLIVFVDRYKSNSMLLNVHNNLIDTVKVWPENLMSSSPDVLSMVINMTSDLFPADEYNLVVWGHGTGWVPSSALPYIDSQYFVPGTQYSLGWYQRPLLQNIDSYRQIYTDNEEFRHHSLHLTKALNAELTENRHLHWMELEEFSAAIPEGMFDCILFDACLMGSVEVAYELRGKTDWMICSAVEILSSGMPYNLIIRKLFERDYAGVCRDYYEYYNAKSGSLKTAAIALVEMDRLDELASAFRYVVDNAAVSVADIDLTDIQHCDRYENPVMFDLMDVAEKLKPGAEAISLFSAALDDCVSSCYHTDYVVSDLKLDTYCGLNCYVPVDKEMYAEKINPSYLNTKWNKAVGFIE